MERKDSWPAYQVECFREKYVLLDAHSPSWSFWLWVRDNSLCPKSVVWSVYHQCWSFWLQTQHLTERSGGRDGGREREREGGRRNRETQKYYVHATPEPKNGWSAATHQWWGRALAGISCLWTVAGDMTSPRLPNRTGKQDKFYTMPACLTGQVIPSLKLNRMSYRMPAIFRLEFHTQ